MVLVYILEDTAALAEEMAAVLRDSGCEVLTYGLAMAFLVAVADRRPDVAVVDLHVPDAKGDAVLLALGPQGPPVIISSATEEFSGNARRMPEIVCYLVKPFDLSDLLGCVADAQALTEDEP